MARSPRNVRTLLGSSYSANFSTPITGFVFSLGREIVLWLCLLLYMLKLTVYIHIHVNIHTHISIYMYVCVHVSNLKLNFALYPRSPFPVSHSPAINPSPSSPFRSLPLPFVFLLLVRTVTKFVNGRRSMSSSRGG